MAFNSNPQADSLVKKAERTARIRNIPLKFLLAVEKTNFVSSEYFPVASDADLPREVDVFFVFQPQKVLHSDIVDVNQLSLGDQ